MLAPVNPLSLSLGEGDGTHAGSSPSFSAEQDMGWSRSSAVYLRAQSFWLFVMNTWKTFSTSLTLPFTFLYGNQGPVSIQLRGQCCPLTFIVSLPNSWMGAKSDWKSWKPRRVSLSGQLRSSFLSLTKLISLFASLSTLFFDQRWETWFILIPQHGMETFRNANTVICLPILKKKKKKKEALKSVISIEVKSINSNILVS